MNQSKELVLREDGKIIEYKDKDAQEIERINKPKNATEERIALYNKLLRTEFKKPETKGVVLDEDEYLTYLEEIIQRDYFPDLYSYTKLNNVKINI